MNETSLVCLDKMPCTILDAVIISGINVEKNDLYDPHILHHNYRNLTSHSLSLGITKIYEERENDFIIRTENYKFLLLDKKTHTVIKTKKHKISVGKFDYFIDASKELTGKKFYDESSANVILENLRKNLS